MLRIFRICKGFFVPSSQVLGSPTPTVANCNWNFFDFQVVNLMSLIFFISTIGLVQSLGVATLNPICEISYEGHTIGDLEENVNGCCLLELGQERCNRMSVDLDKVER